MEEDRKQLLERKLQEARRMREKAAAEAERIRLTDSIDGFSLRYRFADERESADIEKFMSKLHFTFPGNIDISDGSPSEHKAMYLCFLGGSETLLRTYIRGDYSDILSDMDSWECLSHSLLLIDEDMSRYIYIDDNGNMTEASV